MPQPHESSQNSNILISQIASSLALTNELLQNLSTEIREHTVELATMKADLANVTDDVNNLSKILKEGNGTAPVLSRIAVLETTSDRLEDGLDNTSEIFNELSSKLGELNQKVSDASDAKKTSLAVEAADKKSRRTAIVAVVTSIIALVSAILVALLS